MKSEVGVNRTAETQNSVAESYSYDAIDQVTGVTKPGNTQTFAYDATGNRTSVSAAAAAPGVGSYTTNALNQLLPRSPQLIGMVFQTIDNNVLRTDDFTQAGAEVLLHDARGNLTSKGLTASYSYDSKNRLLSATINGGTTSASPVTLVGVSSSFAYDYRNRQVSRTIDGITTYFIYDGWNLIAEYTNAGPPPPVEYLHGAGIDELILKKGPSANLVYYHQDGLGSTMALTDFQGLVVERYTYDVFGSVSITDQLGGALTTSFYGNRFLFTGREWIAEIELYDYRNRIYSPELGRFLQSDPIRFSANDINIYRYCLNSVGNFRDSEGLYTVKSCNIEVHLGHGSRVPDKIDNQNCSAASIVACNAGNHPISKPIPGTSPNTTNISLNDAADKALSDFKEGVKYAKTLCADKDKCCKKVEVKIICSFGWDVVAWLAVPGGVCGKSHTEDCGR